MDLVSRTKLYKTDSMPETNAYVIDVTKLTEPSASWAAAVYRALGMAVAARGWTLSTPLGYPAELEIQFDDVKRISWLVADVDAPDWILDKRGEYRNDKGQSAFVSVLPDEPIGFDRKELKFQYYSRGWAPTGPNYAIRAKHLPTGIEAVVEREDDRREDARRDVMRILRARVGAHFRDRPMKAPTPRVIPVGNPGQWVDSLVDSLSTTS